MKACACVWRWLSGLPSGGFASTETRRESRQGIRCADDDRPSCARQAHALVWPPCAQCMRTMPPLWPRTTAAACRLCCAVPPLQPILWPQMMVGVTDGDRHNKRHSTALQGERRGRQGAKGNATADSFAMHSFFATGPPCAPFSTTAAGSFSQQPWRTIPRERHCRKWGRQW
jgi:hypothetical protein